jgi:outer membrane protein assembly factor BamB
MKPSTLRNTILAAFVAACGLAPNASGADWPMHRGEPQLRGLSTLDVNAGIELAWTFKAPKGVKSGAAIAGDRVFLGDDSGTLLALDRATGKQIWSFKTESAIEAVPLVLDDSVYIGSGDGFLYALERNNGKPRWKYETDDKINGGPTFAKVPEGPATWIITGSNDGNLHCVDAVTGKAVW